MITGPEIPLLCSFVFALAIFLILRPTGSF
jgi:hypothetical protein